MLQKPTFLAPLHKPLPGTQTFVPFSMTGAFELLSIVAQIYLYLGKTLEK